MKLKTMPGATLLCLMLMACSNEQPEPANQPEASKPAVPAASVESQAAVNEQATTAEPAKPGPQAVSEEAALESESEPTSEAAPGPAAVREPQQHIVKGVVTQWRPMILFIEPGDTVVFRQMSGHDTESMDGLFPADAKPWRSQLGEEGFTVTPTVEGAYLYKCNPHVSSGMIGAIVVGKLPPSNLSELEASAQNKGMTGRAIRKLKQALEAKNPL